MKRINQLSFRYRIFAGNLLVAMVPLVLCSVLMLNIFTDTLQRQSVERGEQQAEELAGQLAAVMRDGDAALRELAADRLMQRALVDHTTDELTKDVYLALYQATNGVRSRAGFTLYDAGGQLQFTTQDAPQKARVPVSWGLLRKAAREGGTVYMADPQSSYAAVSSICLRAARQVTGENGVRIGYVECSITVQQLRQILAGLAPESGVAFLFTPQGRLVYSSHAGVDDEAEALRAAMLGGAAPAKQDMLYFCRTDPASGCLLVLRQPAALSSGAGVLMRSISFISAAICIVLCVLISFLLSRSLFSPIARLSGAMQQVRAGDLTARVPVAGRDEIGQLTEDFNAMTGQLETYVARQVQHQKDLNEAQIRQMQAQLNPHFLYNTLDTMKWLAKIHQLPEVARLAGNLAGILRCSIASEQFVTLQQELALLQRYIDIQKIRFADKFEYVLDVPEPLMELVVPKLILQPLVENAILHGLDASASGCIYIYGRCSDGVLTIAVTDDGCGMPAEMVERLNSPEPKMLEGHLGLYNLSRIVQLYYGPGYGLHANSRAGVGTTVTVRLPATKGESHA